VSISRNITDWNNNRNGGENNFLSGIKPILGEKIRENSIEDDSGSGIEYNFLDNKKQSIYKSMQKTLRSDVDGANLNGINQEEF
jgi:hypothetical protein